MTTTLAESVKMTASNASDSTRHEPTGIRKVALSEYKQAARTLAEAFLHDPVGRYAIDTPAQANLSVEEKWKLHLIIFEYITYAHIMNGEVLTVGDDYGCVAAW